MMNRRSIIGAGLLLPAWGIFAASRGSAALVPTPACGESPSLTPGQTAGPYFLENTPPRQNFTSDGDGQELFVGGFLVSTECKPIAGAVIELWHTDANGNYDRRGYRFRGHMRTGEDGAYGFQTIRPGRYTFRTEHYHLKVFIEGRRILTTQLYFPDAPANARDGLFDPALLMAMQSEGGTLSARYDLIVGTV